MNHLMLDLETFGISSNAHILQIAIVEFDPWNSKTAPRTFFNRVMNLRPQPGAIIDISTVHWWMCQPMKPPMGTDELVEELRGLQKALSIAALDVGGLWSNGPTFDEVILRNAFERQGLEFPLGYHLSRDVRTVKMLEKEPKLQRPDHLPKHDALSDAVWQAMQVSTILEGLR